MEKSWHCCVHANSTPGGWNSAKAPWALSLLARCTTTHTHTRISEEMSYLKLTSQNEHMHAGAVYANLDSRWGALDGSAVSRGLGMSGTAGIDYLWPTVAVSHTQSHIQRLLYAHFLAIKPSSSQRIVLA